MALQFYFGPSGSGKSHRVHRDIITWAEKEPGRSFLFLVPDQFTMQTQLDLVNASEKKGIMNIDVLSFGRLAHRIFEETGFTTETVLDDTGKSLILRRIAEKHRENLSVIGKNLNRIGYIHEVKSALSEFMQYGLTPEDVDGLAGFAGRRGTLSGKLKDLGELYRAFLACKEGKFITTEETLELLTRAVEQSAIIRDSVIIFDGFTGFTPIQNRLIQRLMELTERVIVSITIGMHDDPYKMAGDQELFYLSKKTVRDLCRLAEEASVEKIEDVYLKEEPVYRFLQNPALAHLEKSLFRYPFAPFAGKTKALQLSECLSPAGEARAVAEKIRELVLSKGYSYRDIAVIVGDMETYGDYLDREGERYEIPMFMDRTRGLLLNPFIEFIRSSLKMVLTNFSYESVFHYLRSGLAGFGEEEVDRLENYVVSLGIRGRKSYQEVFVRKGKGIPEEKQALFLAGLNVTREKLMLQMMPLLEKHRSAGEYVRMLYDFIVQADMAAKLAAYEQWFQENGRPEKAREYAQVYRFVMELLEQIEALLKDEEMSLQEFADILDAGFAEIEIGIIPGSVDRVVVGDTQRTRLKQVKILFFLGVNDGNIPKSGQGGGIISDIDREFLQTSGIELAPTPRQEMYIQRLYLYMNLTKPSERLYLSYARCGSDGKSIRPSYLISLIERMFPGIHKEYPDMVTSVTERLCGSRDGLLLLAEGLQAYREGRREHEKETAALLKLYRQSEDYRELAEEMTEAAFAGYSHSPLSEQVAREIYGTMLQNSISRLERYAACAYSHFLQYGLQLREREEYSFEPADLGNIYHMVLERFAGKLAEHGKTWFNFDEKEADAWLKEALLESTTSYGETILYSNARYEYMTERILRILRRTVRTLKTQLLGGAFVPSHFEMSFQRVEDLDAVNIALSEHEKMKLQGRIDRIDTFEDEEHVYVKVIDYKSGNKKFDLAALYYGLQLQLVVYMNVAVEMEKRRNPGKEVVPAALLYYHVADPLVKEEKELSPEEINDRMLKELRTTGIVSAEEPVVSLLDRTLSGKSLLIPVERKKDGSFSASSSVVSKEDYEVISGYVNEKIRQFGREILSGNMAVSPCEMGQGTACTYCAYRSVCSFDEKLPGYQVRELKDEGRDAIMEKMREAVMQEKAGDGSGKGGEQWQ